MPNDNALHLFTCDGCGRTFKAARPDEEAYAERKQTFGVSPVEAKCNVYCDACYEVVMTRIAVMNAQRN